MHIEEFMLSKSLGQQLHLLLPFKTRQRMLADTLQINVSLPACSY